MTRKPPPLELERILALPEADLDLAQVALLIAREEYPALDVGVYLRRLDELAANLRDRSGCKQDTQEKLLALGEFLFERQGFSGDPEHYYDPRNSFLNEVLDRRLGIPITLSIVYMEVGWRIGLPLHGVAFPGHFLVKMPVAHGEVVIDPYGGGASLSLRDLQELLNLATGEVSSSRPALARALAVTATKKQILARVLRNLKAIYLHDQQLEKALWTIDRILLMVPESTGELRDRGRLYERLECSHAALTDYRNYLRLEPDADDGEEIRARVVDLSRYGDPLH